MLALCGAQPLPPPTALPSAAVLPSAIDLLPSGSAYEAGQFFIVADMGRGPKPVLEPHGFEGETSDSTALSAKALRIEALVLLPAQPSARPSAASLPDTFRKLALILNSVHSLEGFEYWSASRQRMRTLYAEVYRVDSPSKVLKLPDPTGIPEAAPGYSRVFYAYQRDLTFGGNVQKYAIRIGPASVVMTNENATTLRYFLLPLVQPGKMRARILIVPCAEGLLVHFMSTLEALDVAAGRVFESAGNKALAVLGWFARETAAAGLTEEPRLPKNIDEVERVK